MSQIIEEGTLGIYIYIEWRLNFYEDTLAREYAYLVSKVSYIETQGLKGFNSNHERYYMKVVFS